MTVFRFEFQPGDAAPYKETPHKNLGNELLATMKTYRSELEAEVPTDYAELQAVVRGGLLRMLPPGNKRYQDLLRLFGLASRGAG